MTTETRAVLLAAAELIEREGWIRGAHHNSDGYCCQGAILDSVSTQTDASIAIASFERYLISRGSAHHLLPCWNDWVCPDAATAVRELRACAGVVVDK